MFNQKRTNLNILRNIVTLMRDSILNSAIQGEDSHRSQAEDYFHDQVEQMGFESSKCLEIPNSPASQHGVQTDTMDIEYLQMESVYPDTDGEDSWENSFCLNSSTEMLSVTDNLALPVENTPFVSFEEPFAMEHATLSASSSSFFVEEPSIVLESSSFIENSEDHGSIDMSSDVTLSTSITSQEVLSTLDGTHQISGHNEKQGTYSGFFV